MRFAITVLVAAVFTMTGSALAFHKDGHSLEFPGSASGQFETHAILPGDVCTDFIDIPDGMLLAVHGGPERLGFVSPDEIEVIPIDEANPETVQLCLVDGLPREEELQVRISFVTEADEGEVKPDAMLNAIQTRSRHLECIKFNPYVSHKFGWQSGGCYWDYGQVWWFWEHYGEPTRFACQLRCTNPGYASGWREFGR